MLCNHPEYSVTHHCKCVILTFFLLRHRPQTKSTTNLQYKNWVHGYHMFLTQLVTVVRRGSTGDCGKLGLEMFATSGVVGPLSVLHNVRPLPTQRRRQISAYRIGVAWCNVETVMAQFSL